MGDGIEFEAGRRGAGHGLRTEEWVIHSCPLFFLHRTGRITPEQPQADTFAQSVNMKSRLSARKRTGIMSAILAQRALRRTRPLRKRYGRRRAI